MYGNYSCIPGFYEIASRHNTFLAIYILNTVRCSCNAGNVIQNTNRKTPHSYPTWARCKIYLSFLAVIYILLSQCNITNISSYGTVFNCTRRCYFPTIYQTPCDVQISSFVSTEWLLRNKNITASEKLVVLPITPFNFRHAQKGPVQSM